MSELLYERALLWIILLPLLAAILNGLLGRFADKDIVSALGVGSVAGSFLLALICFAHLFTGMGATEAGAQIATSVAHGNAYEWFHISLPTLGGGTHEVSIQVRFLMDALSGLMTLVVTGVGLVIHIYSLGYMKDDPGYARFFAYLNLFLASMLILVLGSSLPIMFVGWEGVGLCSYLLIGFWYQTPAFAAAGKKAFIANRIGDFGVIIGMFILVSVAGSFEFAEINSAAPEMVQPFYMGTWQMGTLATAAALFLFLGCTGKSAQIPLYVWLPDAMAGPTPVSALIHAATMVTAGVYLTCRLSPVFLQSPVAMTVIAIVGSMTALVAASIAVAQHEMKKILAYSTVSQLGFMFAAVGVGAFSAGFYHVFTHAFFKACLFLGAGSVMHAVGSHSDADIFKLGGLRKIMPRTHATFLLASLSIAGFPLFAGFFSKDEILLGAAELAYAPAPFSANWVGWFVLIVLGIAATLTAFYMFRMYFLAFWGDYRSAGEPAAGDHHAYDPKPHESPDTMTWPLVILAGGAALAGLLSLPHEWHLTNWWAGWMSHSIASVHVAVAHVAEGAEAVEGAEHAETMVPYFTAMAFGLTAVIVGIGAAYKLYFNRSDDRFRDAMPKGLYQLMADKWRVDELYERVILGPIAGLATFVGWIDKTFVDSLLTWIPSQAAMLSGFLATRIQNGRVHAYGAVMVAGLAVTAWFFVTPHPDLEVEAEGATARFEAAPGMGYAYRWDFESDGTWDAPAQEHGEGFGAERSPSHEYAYAAVTERVLLIAQANGDDERLVLSEEPQTLPTSILPAGWMEDPTADATPPSIRFEHGEAILRRNSAALGTPQVPITDEELHLGVGDRLIIGRPGTDRTSIMVRGLVEATVEIENAFGNRSRQRVEVLLNVPPDRAEPDPQARLTPQVRQAASHGEVLR